MSENLESDSPKEHTCFCPWETNEDIPKEELQKLFPYSSPRGETGINLLTMLAGLEAKQRRLMSKVFT